jgi:signal transduction histidine kinase
MEKEERIREVLEADLLASSIHETRRPLGLARGYTQMLYDESLGPLTDPQRRALERIEEKLREASDELARLDKIANLQTRALNRRNVVIGDEVRDAVRRATAKSELRGGMIDVRSDETVVAQADRTLVARILDNLLDNALTYSDGAPEVAVEVGWEDGPFVKVSDHGFGLSEDGIEAVFTRSFRDRPADVGRPGSGLGLYLSRRAAEQMGGWLTLERSLPGGGATFRLDLRPGT